MPIANQDIRDEIKESGLKMWYIAEKLGMQDSSFSRKLRHELPDTEKAKIRVMINQLKGMA